jgi:2-C-methyl-D-erythritol 4-phosphate cytidylyltransferase
MQLAVIIPAAGASRRYSQPEHAPLGATSARSKLDEDLGGRPVLHRTIELFTQLDQVKVIVVAGPADDEAFDAFKLRHGDRLGFYGATLVRGGLTHRYETVRNALAHVPATCSHVAVHDAARPCASPELIARVLEAAADHDAVIPAVPVSDTLKRVGAALTDTKADPLAAIFGTQASPARAVRPIEATVDRASLVAVQTPQVFRRELLLRAYQQTNLESTDDAQLVERLGERGVTVAGEPGNIKITLAGDLAIARAILGFRPPADKPAHLKF